MEWKKKLKIFLKNIGWFVMFLKIFLFITMKKFIKNNKNCKRQIYRLTWGHKCNYIKVHVLNKKTKREKGIWGRNSGTETRRLRKMAARQKAVATLPSLIRTLKNDRRKPGFSQPLPSLRRAFSLYDQINLIDNVPKDQLRFQRYCPNFPFLSLASISFLNLISLIHLCGALRYTETGFTVNGVDYEGSLLCVGNLLMSWSPKKFSEITPDRFALHFLFLNLQNFIYFLHSFWWLKCIFLQLIYLPDCAPYSR